MYEKQATSAMVTRSHSNHSRVDKCRFMTSRKEALDHCLRLSDLADKALLSHSNLTHLVDRLEKAGLLITPVSYSKYC